MKHHALDDIYQAYVQDIYRYLCSLCHDHYTAEDIVHETFYRAYLFLEDCPAAKVKPWLFKVAHNAFIDYTRKHQRCLVQQDILPQRNVNTQTPETAVLQREMWREINQTICNLPEHQKQAILLVDFHGLSYQEAAEAMDVSINYFKVLLFRARQKVRQATERTDSDE